MKENPLGKDIQYKGEYNKDLLFFISRAENRKNIEKDSISFTGYDIWNAYEVSWLNKKGKPCVRRAVIIYPSDSENIVESKSLKLYLGSFTMTMFDNEKKVIETITTDLNDGLNTKELKVKLLKSNEKYSFTSIDENFLVDELDVKITDYVVNSSLLEIEETNEIISDKMYSNLLKTNCPITSQPDWATVIIEYEGHYKLKKESFLKYIISYREHQDYHEACCENIFADLFKALSPKKLSVKCFFTRRGGIDINPCRFYGNVPDYNYNLHFWRQ